MKYYDVIKKWSQDFFGQHIFAFEKIDGSNIRVEWNRKLAKKSNTFGFKKYGTRNELISSSSAYYPAAELFFEKYAEDLCAIFLTEKTFPGIQTITVFLEFHGPKSFAGRHDWEEVHDVKLLDVYLDHKDYLAPNMFLKAFEKLDFPKLIYQGEFTEEFLQNIVKNIDLSEGVVCKGLQNQKVFMFKIKTQKWLNLVKAQYGETEMLQY